MSAFSTMVERFRNYRSERRAFRQHAATYMAVHELPAHIRKDIGWPTAYDNQRGYH